MLLEEGQRRSATSQLPDDALLVLTIPRETLKLGLKLPPDPQSLLATSSIPCLTDRVACGAK